MKRKTPIVIIIILLGIGLLLYPTISNYLYERSGMGVITDYENAVKKLTEEDFSAALKEAELYNENLVGNPVHDPFVEGSGIAMPENYRQVLGITEIMGYIEIPKINLYLPIYHGTSDEVLKKGSGHLEGSSFPVGGIPTHSVLTGHSGLVNAKMFTDLPELVKGDLFYIHILDRTLAYRVEDITIIEPHFTDDLKRFEGKDYVTLMTCTPYGINTHRLLVRGERTEYIAEEKEKIESAQSLKVNTLILLTAVITTAAVIIVIIIVAKVTKKKPKKLYDYEDVKMHKNRKKAKSKLRYVVVCLTALLGIGIMLYPVVLNWIYNKQTTDELNSFLSRTGIGLQETSDSVKNSLPYEELYLFLKRENERLFATDQQELVDAFSYETIGIDLSEYGIEDGCIGFIEIPSLEILLPVYLGANNENMRKGAVHLTQTSYPIGGENTNAVIAAHRGSSKEMFRNIHKIKVGDEIIITNFRERLVYRAVESRIILPSDINDIKIQQDKEMLTLLSCDPIGQSIHRYVLYCERVYDE